MNNLQHHEIRARLATMVSQVPQLKGQQRANVASHMIVSLLEQGGKLDDGRRSAVMNDELLMLLDSYTQLRVRGYHSSAAFAAIFCDGCEIDDMCQRVSFCVPLIESHPYYRAMFDMTLKFIDMDAIWSAAIARKALNDLSASAAKNGSGGTAISAMKEARKIRPQLH